MPRFLLLIIRDASVCIARPPRANDLDLCLCRADRRDLGYSGPHHILEVRFPVGTEHWKGNNKFGLANLCTSSCRPLYKMWQIWPDPGEICYASNSPILVWGYWVCNIVTDIYLILIPLPVLLRTSLTSKQKFALVTLFSCTIGITIFGVARLVLIELVSISLDCLNNFFFFLSSFLLACISLKRLAGFKHQRRRRLGRPRSLRRNHHYEPRPRRAHHPPLSLLHHRPQRQPRQLSKDVAATMVYAALMGPLAQAQNDGE